MNSIEKQERYFCVKYKDRSYSVLGSTHTTIETVWRSQKCFFMPGSEVTIFDDKGNSQKFVA